MTTTETHDTGATGFSSVVLTWKISIRLIERVVESRFVKEIV